MSCLTTGQRSNNISAWRDAQKLMKDFLGASRTPSPQNNRRNIVPPGRNIKENIEPSGRNTKNSTASVGPQGDTDTLTHLPCYHCIILHIFFI